MTGQGQSDEVSEAGTARSDQSILPQIDGNISDFSSSSGESATGAHAPSAAPPHLQSPTAALTAESQESFHPPQSSTQYYDDDLMGQHGDAAQWVNPMPLGPWMRAMREGIPQITPDPSSSGSQSPVPLPLGESWVGSPLDESAANLSGTTPDVPDSQKSSNNITASISNLDMPTQVGNISRSELAAMSPPTQLAGPALNAWRKEQEDLYGVSPSAFLYALQEPCVFLQKVINI